MMVKAAIELAKYGLGVIRVAPKNKHPIEQHGAHDATNDVEKISRRWFEKPRSNIGIACGKKWGIIGVDCDVNHGFNPELLKDHKLFPRTVTEVSGQGFHLYYKYIDNPKSVLMKGPKGVPCCEIRSNGKYFVGAPSIVTQPDKSEFEYHFHSDLGGELSFEDCPIAKPPEWFFKSHKESNLPLIPVGNRHNHLKDAIIAMFHKGKTIEQIRSEAKMEVLRFATPLENQEQEIDKLIEWGQKEITPNNVEAPQNTDDIINIFDYVKCLGTKENSYYFITTFKKNITTLSISSFSEKHLDSLLPLNMWKKSQYAYITNDKNPKVKVDWKQIASDLKNKCHEIGEFESKKIRGIGAWRDDNKLVLHLGKTVIYDDKELELSQIKSNYVYVLRPVLNNPTTTALTVKECEPLLDILKIPEWKNPADYKLLAGWCALARLMGAMKWRSHVWILAKTSAGKSTIVDEIVEKIFPKNTCISVKGATTAAGIYQKLECDNKPVVFDEAEGHDKKSADRMSGILDLCRISSTENSSSMLKGTSGGVGKDYNVSSPFLISSVRLALKEETDFNRFSILELNQPDYKTWPDKRDKFYSLPYDYGVRLFKRMCILYPQILATQLIFEDAISNSQKRRMGQQYGTLLAGYWHLTSNETPTVAMAIKLLDKIHFNEIANNLQYEDDEVECLQHLLASKIHLTFTDKPKTETIGTIIGFAAGGKAGWGENQDVYNQELQKIGLFIDRDEPDYLFVSHKNPELSKIYEKSRWFQNWTASLKRLPDCKANERKRFCNARPRGVLIPLTHITIDEE
jgi:putative DNA primase/helicase